MNNEYLEKIEKEIETRYNKESLRYRKSYAKKKILQENLIETNIPKSLLTAGLIEFSLSKLIVAIAPSLLSLIPVELVCPTLGIASLGIGGFCTKLVLSKINGTKELEILSKFKNDIDKKEEIAINEIEIVKALNKKSVLNDIKERIHRNSLLIDEVKQFEYIEVNTVRKNKKDLEEDIDNLEKRIENNYKILDDLSVQFVINSKFEEFHLYGIIARISDAMMGCFLLGSYFCVPYFVMSTILSFTSSSQVLLPIITPFIVGALSTTVYSAKKINDSKKMYSKLYQNMIGEDLPRNSEEVIQRHIKLNKKIDDTASKIVEVETKMIVNNWLLEIAKEENIDLAETRETKNSEKADEIIKLMENSASEAVERPKIYMKL